MGRRAIVLLVALILAGVAAWAVWRYLQTVQATVEEGQVQVDVFRAGPQGIAEGTDGNVLISNYNQGGMLIEKSTDELEDIPAGVIDTEEKLRQVLGGKVAAGPISAGSILTASQWTEVTVEIVPLADKIPSGKQALTIGTNNIQGVNGFVEPGDRINMIITLEIQVDQLPDEFPGVVPPEEEPTATTVPGEPQSVTITRYVMQGIPVLATGREVRPDPDAPAEVTVAPETTGEEGVDAGNPTVFTLEVTPEQAERIVFAMQAGTIWLTLVPPDFVEVETPGVTIDTLFGGDLLEDIFGTSP